MKFTLKQRITAGFILNVLVVSTVAIVHVERSTVHKESDVAEVLDWSVLSLIGFSLILLGIVYYVMRKQVKERDVTRELLEQSEQLLHSVIDNTSSPVCVKKLNGEYLLVNKRYGEVFNIDPETIIGRTDSDLLSKDNAKIIRSADMEVIKEGNTVSSEQTLEFPEGPRTFLGTKFPLYDSANKLYAVGGISTEITDRKEAEESMRDRNRFFEMSFDALFVADDNHFLKVNPAICDKLGYTEAELINKPWSNFIHPDDREATLRHMDQLLQGRQIMNYETRFLCKDGTAKWFDLTIAVLKIGNSAKFYAVGHDITELKDIMAELKVYECFFYQSFDLMAVADGTHYLMANPAYKRLLGYDPKEISKANIGDFAHPEEKNSSVEAISKLVQDQGSSTLHYTGRIKAKDNSYKWVEWNASKDKNKDLYYGIARDITDKVLLKEEQREMLGKLNEREQRLRLILDNVSDGILVINSKGDVVMSNHLADQIYGNSNDKEVKYTLAERYEIYYSDGETTFPLQELPKEKALKGQETEDVELLLKDKKNLISKNVLMSGRPIVNRNKQVIAVVITIRDISRYKQLEAELIETKKKYKSIIGFRRDS